MAVEPEVSAAGGGALPELWWVVPDDTLQQIAYDATHAADSQGYAGYVKESQTQPTSGSYGPYQTQAAAQSELATLSTAQHQAQTTTVPIPNPLTGLNAIGDAFQRLTQASFWERAGEVILGLILIAMGVAHLTHAVPVATKIAKTAGAAAVVA